MAHLQGVDKSCNFFLLISMLRLLKINYYYTAIPKLIIFMKKDDTITRET